MDPDQLASLKPADLDLHDISSFSMVMFSFVIFYIYLLFKKLFSFIFNKCT